MTEFVHKPVVTLVSAWAGVAAVFGLLSDSRAAAAGAEVDLRKAVVVAPRNSAGRNPRRSTCLWTKFANEPGYTGRS